MTRSEKRWNILAHVVLTVFSIIILFPILWTLRTSFAEDVIAYEIPPRLIFKPTLKNYISIFVDNNFIKHFKNSFVVAISTTVVSIPIAALVGSRHGIGAIII